MSEVRTPEVLTLKEFAALARFQQSYCTQLKREGRLVMTDDGKLVRVAESLARIEATRDPSKAGVAARHADARGEAALTGHAAQAADVPAAEGDDDQAGGLGYDYQNSKAKREHYAAEREHMAFRKEAGELMEASLVVSAFADAGAVVRTRVESWQSNVAPRLVGLGEAAIRAVLADEGEALLRDMVGALSRSVPQSEGDAG